MLTLRTADLQIDAGGSAFKWDPMGTLSQGARLALRSIWINGDQVNLYGLDRIDSGGETPWSTQFSFCTGERYVGCINLNAQQIAYDGTTPLQFNLYDKHFNPINTSLRNGQVRIELDCE